MQKLLVLGLLALTAGSAQAQNYLYGGQGRSSAYGNSYGYGTGSNPSGHYVQPYVNSQGSYTGGHFQSNPNGSTLDNWSTRGNVNPYTGQSGTRNPYR